MSLLMRIADGHAPTDEEALALAECEDLAALMECAGALRDQAHGALVSYSRKVFIPLTQLCRDSCHYCTFAQPPRRRAASYLTPEEVLAIARAGAAAGCKEALFTLGDKPELRYRAARDELARLGYPTTLSYLTAMAELVLRETSLLPHLNPGAMKADDIERLRMVSVSQGLMLETAAERLSRRGGPHFGSPDKLPSVRLATIAAAGAAQVPFTSGILIGIGETRHERIEALLALRAAHRQHGHLQEIIIQNFRAKPDTRMAPHADATLDEHLWSIAVARLVLGSAINIQAPPNLQQPESLPRLIAAGINDWGGVSPVTPDHVNPERPWPALDALAQATAAAGKMLVERLAIYPHYVQHATGWIAPKLRPRLLRMADADGLARADDWTAGASIAPPASATLGPAPGLLTPILDRAARGNELSEDDIVTLFGARGESFHEVCKAADALRAQHCGSRVSYVVTRNINYTNVCSYRCTFCAFSKGKTHAHLRGRPYDLTLEEIVRRCREAYERGAVEVCLQGGIHPDYTGATYLAICRAIKSAIPKLHIHAFSPLEIFQGAATLGMAVEDLLAELKEAGLGSLPGTAAEILDDEVRRVICPDKLSTAQWLAVIEAAHRVGLKTTATIMYGHVDAPVHWARHLLHIRRLQAHTGGFTELVPLPFVPMEAPMQLRGESRLGPTWREAVLMHAVARLALNPLVPNIQTSWVKMGSHGAASCLAAGANDLGGTLMNESITRAAGAVHGQEMPPEAMEALIRSLGRSPCQRTTLYRPAPADRTTASFAAPPLAVTVDTPVRRRDGAHAARTVRSPTSVAGAPISAASQTSSASTGWSTA
ncbi:MAG: 5-amino-6-(D-ribitylamino)uracil--L-tyrosine 4-hydroxyphenyl transferase CofH [Hyphomicrobiales bacterium]|nr:5-amino-6-(D-ribitylamino)uracil--L-tyrosine 4-hydroxyphenyl transferase CofH [Hyphomicrobiales bacterium]